MTLFLRDAFGENDKYNFFMIDYGMDTVWFRLHSFIFR